jgi:putative MATE family efflux protein
MEARFHHNGVTFMSHANYDLTRGGIIRKLLLVAGPIIANQIVQMLYNLTDMFWLGRIGGNAVAAAGSAGMYMWLSQGFFTISQMGSQIGVSQSLGRGDKKSALNFFQNALSLAIGLGIIYATVMLLFTRQLIGFFHYKELDVTQNASAYLSIVAVMMPFNFIINVFSGTFQGSGNSRTPFLVNLCGVITNVVLDPLLILVFKMGVPGAAIATAFSQFVSVIAIVVVLFGLHIKPFEGFFIRLRLDKYHTAQILRWGVPVGLQTLFFCFLSMVTSRIEAQFGAAAVAADKIGSQVESLSWMIGGGYSSALVAFIGQNFGAKKWTRIRRGLKLSVFILLGWTGFVTIFLWTGGPWAFSLFLPQKNEVALGTIYVRIIAFCEIFSAFESTCSGGFTGTGRTIPPAVVVLCCNGLRPILAWLLSRGSLGVYGVWIAITLTAIMRGVFMPIWFLAYQRRLPHNDGESLDRKSVV